MNSTARWTIGAFGVAALLAATWLFILPLANVSAGELAKPTGRVLLVVKGAIENTNIGNEAHFDEGMLEALGHTSIKTGTPWHEDNTVFEGVLVRNVLRAAGAKGTTVNAVAANDYTVAIPIDDFERYDVLLAMAINGEQLTLRTKGPLWVIYPDDVDLAARFRIDRMIWQLTQLQIE